MSSFLIDNYGIIYKGSEILAATTGLFYYKKFRSKAARIFIWFLVYVLFIETFAGYPSLIESTDYLNWLGDIVEGTIFSENYWFYDIFWNITGSIILSYYFYLVSKDKLLKKIIKTSIVIFLIASIVLLFSYYKILLTNFILSIEVLSLFLILMVVFSYLIELLNSNNILNFYKSLSFYIAIGVLVFWLVITPMSFYEQYYHNSDPAFIALKTYIYLFSIVFMYLSFTVGFIVSKPEHD